MKTLWLTGKTGIQTAIDLLKQGEVVAFPTETVYGLGANAMDPSAISKIFEAKNRPQDNPLIIHCADIQTIEKIATDIPDDFYKLAEHFMPGPLTLILKKHPSIPDIASAGLDTIGVRIPKAKIALEILKSTGPLVAPSANLSTRPSSTHPEHVRYDLNTRIAGIVAGGECEFGLESTILDLTSAQPTLLRPGHITKQQIETVLNKAILLPDSKQHSKNPKAPGMKYRHYAPNAKIILLETLQDIELDKNCWILMSKEYLKFSLNWEPNQTQLLDSKTLYHVFREADKNNIKTLYIYCDPQTKLNLGLYNRLLKASL